MTFKLDRVPLFVIDVYALRDIKMAAREGSHIAQKNGYRSSFC